MTSNSPRAAASSILRNWGRSSMFLPLAAFFAVGDDDPVFLPRHLRLQALGLRFHGPFLIGLVRGGATVGGDPHDVRRRRDGIGGLTPTAALADMGRVVSLTMGACARVRHRWVACRASHDPDAHQARQRKQR